MKGIRRAFVALAILWVALLPIAAFAASHSPSPSAGIGYGFAFVIYRIGSVICQQRPERSFHLFAVQMPVCARCTGIYAGAALMAAVVAWRGVDGVRLLSRSGSIRRGEPWACSIAARGVLLMSLMPNAATLVYEWSTNQMPAHWIRAMSGVMLGAAVAWIVCGITSGDTRSNVIN
jgi:hypothetical protein